MAKECFTCLHKLSRDLSNEEKQEFQRKNIEKTGRKTLFVPEQEYTCEVSGKIISQIDIACDNYLGYKLMEDIRKDISESCRKMREELNK